MRALLVLVVLAPMALAQAPGPTLHLEAQDFAQPLVPLVASASTPFLVTVDCRTLAPATDALALHVWIEDIPQYASAVPVPSEFAVDPNACRVEGATFAGEVVLGVDATAPAHAVQALRVRAALEGDLVRGNLSTETNVSFVAAWFGLLDASLSEAVKRVAPGDRVSFDVQIANRGNGRTLVAFEAREVPDGFLVDVPAAFTLESAAQGGFPIQEVLPVVVRASAEGPLAHRVGAIQLEVRSRDAQSNATGDTSSISLLVEVRGAATTPGPATWMALLAALGAARLRR